MSAAFDHAAMGTTEQSWAASPLVDLPDVSIPPDVDRTIVLAAHPDDETLGAGGLIHAVWRRGRALEVIIASDGERSHPHSPTHTADRLARRRRAEAADAVRVLAPDARVSFLGLPDGALSDRVETVVAELRARLAPTTWLVAPWIGDRHPDHAACARAALTLAARAPGPGCWQYPIWAWHWAVPTSPRLPWHQMRRLELDVAAVGRKKRALARYVSQQRALSHRPGDEPILPAGILEHFLRPFETFVLPIGRDGAREPSAADPAYFDALYAAADDPWGLRTHFYEARKRDLLLAALPRARFRHAFEPGCAIGLLTESLAARCDAVLAWDVAPRALDEAGQRLRGLGNVELSRGQVPQQWPDGEFDLIVLSEIGYYCRSLPALAARIDASLAPDGVVVACHWRHPAPAHPHTADEVHDAIATRLRRIVRHAEEDFRLDVWTRSGESVARADGLLG